MVKPRTSAASEGGKGTGVEKRSHPTPTSHYHGAGSYYSGGVAGDDTGAYAVSTAAAAGFIGSPAIWHLSKGRGFSGEMRVGSGGGHV